MRAKRDPRGPARGPSAEVLRTRLLRQLRHATTYRVAAIVAPGGYGKSMLARQFLAEDPRRHVVVRFRTDDGELDDAVRRLCDALEEAAPHARTNLAAALRAVGTTAARPAHLARWLLRHLEDDGWLITLDDLHHCTSPEVRDFLTELVSAETSNQWFLIARVDMGLPFALWTASGQMDAPLRADDLKFDLDELDAFGDVVGATLAESELEAILERTGAWPMAAAFAVRTADRRQSFPETLGATRELVFDYFAQDAFAALTFEQRDVVVAAAELPELDIEVLEAAGFASARWTFSILAQRTAFVRREPGEIFRLHDLFREYLRAQRDHVLDRTVIARLAGLVLEHAPAEALRMLARHDLRDEIGAALERHGFALIDHGASDTVTRALAKLGARVRSPIILALRATLDAAQGANQSAAAHYTRALREASGADYLTIALPYALWLLTRNEAAESLEILLGIEPERLSSQQATEYWGLLGIAYATSGDARRARGAMQRAAETVDLVDDEYAAARSVFRSAYVAYMSGDLSEAERLALETTGRCRQAGYATIADRAYSILCTIAHAREDNPRAMYYAEQVMHHAARAGDGPAQRNALVMRFAISVELGDVALANRLREELRRFPIAEGIRTTATETFADAVLSVAMKRYRDAAATLERAETVSLSESERAAVAALRGIVAQFQDNDEIARKEVRMAKRWLSVRRSSERGGHEASLATIARFLTVALDFALGREGEARRALRELRRRGDSPLVAAFLERVEGAGSAGLPEVPQSIYLSIADELLAWSKRRRRETPLTPTEMLVLTHLAEGETDKEIAAALGVRTTTISNHVAAITGKLHCRGRYRAVAIARELGYLDQSHVV